MGYAPEWCAEFCLEEQRTGQSGALKPVSLESVAISMMRDPQAAKFVSVTPRLPFMPCRRLIHAYGSPAEADRLLCTAPSTTAQAALHTDEDDASRWRAPLG